MPQKTGSRSLLKVEEVDTMVAQTNDGGLGGGTPPVVTSKVGIEEFPKEVASICFHCYV
jgi:hypothetical protein